MTRHKTRISCEITQEHGDSCRNQFDSNGAPNRPARSTSSRLAISCSGWQRLRQTTWRRWTCSHARRYSNTSRLFFALSSALVAACGSSPAAPAPVPIPVPVPPSTITLSGHVTATNGGQALPGLQATLGASTVSTDGSGGFTFQTLPTGALALALTGSGIVPRSVFIAAGSSRSVTVDAISTTGFDLNFYRELVRNSFEGGMEPLRRWNQNPSIYIQTGADAATLDMVERTIRETVPLWTAGKFHVDAVERGTDTKEGLFGWLTVKWATTTTTRCGIAPVGDNGGWIEFYPKTAGCSCQGTLSRTVIRHELGHAMGFWHTDSFDDVMYPVSVTCDGQPSARELAAASIAYSRPLGNADPDTDPITAVVFAVRRVP